ncbi:MAG TPA: hypothetical protein PK431_14255 [Chitinophagales bacterium]|nr:hypothetical protein [Chitinophagales bacterium]
MTDKDFCICSIAFGDARYFAQLERLKESIKHFHPDTDFFYWTNGMPPNAKSHSESGYGFKVHCINYCREQGYKKIIFFDPAVFLVDKLFDYFKLTEQYGIVAAKDDNLLCNYCADEIYNYYGVTREQSREAKHHLVGGSIYAADFNTELCNSIFSKWEGAEKNGIFNYPRNDESCMSLSLYNSGSTPTPYDECRYNDVSNAMVKKIHFK